MMVVDTWYQQGASADLVRRIAEAATRSPS